MIVAMTPAHIDALWPYEHDMFGADAWSRESYAAELDDTDLRHYLAVETEEGELLGWGGVLVVGGTAEILTIGVVPAARRQGLATDLLHALLEVARLRGARECFLEVREDNDAARAFYDREGFRRTRLRRGYYDNGRANAVEMRLELAP
ncbi:ribosomal protein S18-alanine N-acetyltransferase [Jatrophihabitans sp.]|uniref:ribosomal protein S18-alanine N-acetyltransferase n=1 Tax=Jatrophihabitans sp. TaxID=1932789 RepID=UPI0030C68381|nr:ribosomal-protein-alanine acetyltransferase [Jatrophihabitans sp.]